VRLLTAGSIAGALWCLFLAPIESAIWNADEPGPAPLIVSLMGAVIDLSGPIYREVGAPLGLTPYEFWGRLFLPVYLGAIAGVLVIGRRRPHGRMGRASSGLLLGGLLVALAGDVAAYWAHGTALEDLVWSSGFAVELTGLLLVLIGTLLLGAALLRARMYAAGVLLLCGAVLAVPMTFVVHYIPHGTVLPLAVAIAGASWLLIRDAGVRVVVPTEADVAR
jgi:hypothetical protein